MNSCSCDVHTWKRTSMFSCIVRLDVLPERMLRYLLLPLQVLAVANFADTNALFENEFAPSSALFVASSACDHMHDWFLGTPEVGIFLSILWFVYCTEVSFMLIDHFVCKFRALGFPWGYTLMVPTMYQLDSFVHSLSLVAMESGR